MTKKGMLAIINNGIEFFIGSMLLILVTFMYSLEEAGAWIVFITLLFVGTKFREGITQTSLMKFSVGVSREQRFSVYRISILITIGIEGLLGGISALGAMFISDEVLKVLLTNYLWLALPQALFRLFQFISQSRLDVQSMINSNVVLLNIMIMIWMYAYSAQLMLGQLPIVLGVAYWVGLCWQNLMHNTLSWPMHRSGLRLPEGYLNFAMNGLLRELFGTISSRAYILFTAGLVGYTESALVGIASRYANLIYLPNSAYQGLLYPKACELVQKGTTRAMFHFYRRALSWMQAGFIPYVAVLISFGSLGIVLLHGMEFIPALPFFVVLIIAGAFISPYGHAFGSVCQAAGRPDLVTKLVLANSVVNLLLSYIFIASLGVWGAVLAPIATDLAGLVAIQIILKRTFSSQLVESAATLSRRLTVLVRLLMKNTKKLA
ncbi:MAG: polysaccharide biosynthesis C-terminal domain-containing protein [Bacteroidota bacterium]